MLVTAMPRLNRSRSHRSEDHGPARLAFRWLLCAAFVTALVAAAAAQTLTVGKADPARYFNDIKALTAPAMEGRGDDTKGIALAAKMLEQRYKSLGLEPAGTAGILSAFQRDHRREARRQQSHSRANRRASRKISSSTTILFRSAFPSTGQATRRSFLPATARRPMNSATTTTPAST